MPIHVPRDTRNYVVRVSLKQRPDRQVAVFSIETLQRTTGEWVTTFLDRGVTPLEEEVWQEWATALDAELTAGVQQWCGIQLSLLGEEAAG